MSTSFTGVLPGTRLVFTDEAALRQCRSGWMTRYRKLSGNKLTRGTRIRFMRWVLDFVVWASGVGSLSSAGPAGFTYSVYSVSRMPRTINKAGHTFLKTCCHFCGVSANKLVIATPRPAAANQRCCC